MSHKIFTSENYSTKILQNLHELWKTECFCDVQILCGGELFRAHRTVLASSSSYFRAMFTGGMIEQEKTDITLGNISGPIFASILTFIYTGQVFLSQHTVQDMLVASDMLGLPEVVESCTNFLKAELHPSNAIGIYRFAEGHNCYQLETYSLSYIHRHFPQICEEEEFLETPLKIISQLLRSEQLKIDSELQILNGALKWLNYDLPNRKPLVFEILNLVRLVLVPYGNIEKCIGDLNDPSMKVALRSFHRDMLNKRGSLVSLMVQPRKCAKKYMYIFGGSKKELGQGWKQISESTLDIVSCLDTFKKEWKTLRPMNIERILPGVASLEGLVYVVGGEQESKILANGEVYSPQEDVWKTMEPMLIPRCAFGLTAWENYLYAFGGWVGEDIGGSIERYDPFTNDWTMMGDMEEPRFSMGVITFDGLIYIIGGCTHAQRQLHDLLSYNPVTREWKTLAPMKVPRSQMGVAILDHDLYVIGGSTKQAEILRSVERYDFDKNIWSDVAPLKVGRANPAVGAADGHIYVAGGDKTHESTFFIAQVTLASVEIYNPLIDSWEECKSLEESRSEAGAIVI